MEDNLRNSEEFLKSVVDKTTGFSVPKDYFSNTDDRFSLFLAEEKIPKKTGFKTPTNYFSELEESILKQTVAKKETKIISFKKRFLNTIPYAAAACILLFFSINFFNISNNDELNFDNLVNTDIENWVLENNTEFSNEDFVNILNTEFLDENEFVFTDLNNNEIEEYIINTDNTSILNELY
ncbi:hypothetical protein [Polaribacter sp.]|uniref:hypothetical protein n=1 Tax=Polaribacter sp. TaxID=1920175 RepID=UPI003F6BCE5D